MKVEFYNSKKEEICKINIFSIVSKDTIENIYKHISNQLNKQQIVINVINDNQVYTVVRQYYNKRVGYYSSCHEFIVTNRITNNGNTINDSIINHYNNSKYYYNDYNQLIIIIKDNPYTVNSAVYGDELLIDLVPVN